MVISEYDLKTFCKVITTNPTSLGLGYVPTGKQRYITFLRVENQFAGDNKLFIVSVADETYASTPARASTVKKEFFLLSQGAHRTVPEHGPTEARRPLFAIAETKYLNALTDQGAVALTCQYYER